MANTFGGVAFQTEQQDARSVPIWPAEDVLAVEHVAGGNTDIVQHLGKRGTQEVTIPILIKSSDWASFAALHGQTATLVLLGNSSRQATLTKMQNARSFPEGIYKVQATWLG